MVSAILLSELDLILREDYGLKLPPPELVEMANTLVGIFELLAKMDVSSLNENKNYEHTILS